MVQPNFAVTETFSAVDVVEHLSPFEDYWTQADRVLDDMRKDKGDENPVKLGTVVKELRDIFSQANLPKKLTKPLFACFCLLNGHENPLNAQWSERWNCFQTILRFTSRFLGIEGSHGLELIEKLSEEPGFQCHMKQLRESIGNMDEEAVNKSLSELSAMDVVKDFEDQNLLSMAISDIRSSVSVKNSLLGIYHYVNNPSVLVDTRQEQDPVDAIQRFICSYLYTYRDDKETVTVAENALRCLREDNHAEALDSLATLRLLLTNQKWEEIDDYPVFQIMLMKCRTEEEMTKLRNYEALRKDLQLSFCSFSELCELLMLFSECLSIEECNHEALEILTFLADHISRVSVNDCLERLFDIVHERSKARHHVSGDLYMELNDLVQRTTDVLETDLVLPNVRDFLERFLIFLKISGFGNDFPSPGKEQKIETFPAIRTGFPKLFDESKVPVEISDADDCQRREVLRKRLSESTDEAEIRMLFQWKRCIEFEHSLESFTKRYAVTSDLSILEESTDFSRALYECIRSVLSMKDVIQWQQTQRLWLNLSLSLIYREYSTPDAVRQRWVEMVNTMPVPILDFSVQSVLRLLELSITRQEAPELYSLFVDHLVSGSREKWDKLRPLMNCLPELEQYAVATDAINGISDQISVLNSQFFHTDGAFKMHGINLLTTFLRSVFRSLIFAVANSMLSPATAKNAEALIKKQSEKGNVLFKLFDNPSSVTRGSIVASELIDPIRDMLFLDIQPRPRAFLDYLRFTMASITLYPRPRLHKLGIIDELNQVEELIAAPSDISCFRSDVMAILEILVRVRKKLNSSRSSEVVMIREAINKAFKCTIAYANILSFSQDTKLLFFLVLSLDGTNRPGVLEELSKICAETKPENVRWDESFDEVVSFVKEQLKDAGALKVSNFAKKAHRLFSCCRAKLNDHSFLSLMHESLNRSMDNLNKDISERSAAARDSVMALQQCRTALSNRGKHEYQDKFADEERKSKELDAQIEAASKELKALEGSRPQYRSENDLYEFLKSVRDGSRPKLSRTQELLLQLSSLSNVNSHLERELQVMEASRAVYGKENPEEFAEMLKAFRDKKKSGKAKEDPPTLELVSMVHIPTQIFDTLSLKTPIVSREDFFSRCDVVEKFAFELVEEYRVLLDLEQQKKAELEHSMARNLPKLEQISKALRTLEQPNHIP